MAIDLVDLRRRLADLDWGAGLTRESIRLRWPALPEAVYLHLPSEKKFRSADQVLFFIQRRLRQAQQEEIPEDGALGDGGPPAWGESVTGETFTSPDLGHGVGSGANPGYTGGGSVQTGIGREGTTYGDAASSPLPDSSRSDNDST